MVKDNSSNHESDKDNSFDEHKEQKDSSFAETEEEKDNSSGEREEDNSFDELEEEEDNSSDECEEGNNGKRKAVIKNGHKKRKIVEEDNTVETLQLVLQELNNGDRKSSPRLEIRVWIPDYCNISWSDYGRCIYKQLTESDVKVDQSRLMLGRQEVKDKFLSRLRESEIPGVEGVDVLVYGPNGQVNKMKFKIWIKNTPVLANGWSNFVKVYGLKKYSDVLKIWTFKAWKDGKICFVIDSKRYEGITKQLSKKILKSAFKN